MARMDDLHSLPKVRDSLSYLYVEHASIDRHENSIALWDKEGCTPVPVASLCVLMLGPGTRITHAAIVVLADNNCLVVWCGEENVRFYAWGTGGTRSATPLIYQAKMASDEKQRLEVVKRMYRMRFAETPDASLSVEQLRGLEGARVRETYRRLSNETGVPWTGRSYDRNRWSKADPVNRALSCANSCLYGVCHTAILATGYHPGLGFIHWGKQLSFVYDIADLYKTEITIPLAFQMAVEEPAQLERTVRTRCRDLFREKRLLQRIVPDIRRALNAPPEMDNWESPLDEDPAQPTELWTPSWEQNGTAPPQESDDSEESVQPGDAQWGN
jgi:CRISP-associated protein Cas1